MCNKNPIVSVIVPVFNSEATIEATVMSILNQSVHHLEVIIVDDGSNDATSTRCNNLALLDERIRLYRFESPSGGPAKPRNCGISVANGEWVAFCDSDDIWNFKKLEIQLEVGEYNKESIICTQIKEFCLNSNINPKEILNSYRLNIYYFNDMLIKNRVATSSAMIRRNIINRVGNFNESKGLIAIEDYDLWLRVLSMSGSNVCMVDAPLTYYRNSDKSISANKAAMLIKVAKLLWRYSGVQNSGGALMTWTWCMVCYCFLSIKNRLIHNRM
jgi:teichuronic acid biosynthesis glycosyltransferase TuaG